MITIDGRDATHLDPNGKDRELLLKMYETLWRAIERENNLINQRLTWPITLTSFILAESFLAKPIFDQISNNNVTFVSPLLCLLTVAISLVAAEFYGGQREALMLR